MHPSASSHRPGLAQLDLAAIGVAGMRGALRGHGILTEKQSMLDFCTERCTIYRMKAISYSEARANLKSVMDSAVEDRAPVAITRQRGEGVVMVSASEWAAIEETLYLLASPANARHLMDGIAELDAGNGEGHELVEP